MTVRRQHRARSSVEAKGDQIAARIRERRIALGLKQEDLANMIGVTYQQVHKYERSINRVTAALLCDIADKLGVPVNYFSDPPEDAQNSRVENQHERSSILLVKGFHRLSPGRQQVLTRLLRVLLDEGAEEDAPVEVALSGR